MSIFYLSISRNAKADIQATFTGGRLAALDGLKRPVDLFEEYATGPVTIIGGGFDFGAPAEILIPYFARIADEDFESYALGSAGNGSSQSAGNGWNGSPSIHAY